MSRLESARPDSLSVAEMLRIMDVATAIRQDREMVEEQLNVEGLKERLRERMLAASKYTGESVTPEEVDAAIRQYYANLYTFREPKLSFPVALAHAWVRRRAILAGGVVALGALALAWVLLLSPEAQLTPSGRARREVIRLSKEIDGRSSFVRKVAVDPKVPAEVDRLEKEAGAYRGQADPKGLASVLRSLQEMATKLEEQYTVNVVAGRDRKSATLRTYSDRDGRRQPGYYLIVEARSPDGKPLKRPVRNDEDGSVEEVATWGERVPHAVYERLKKDKQDDAILNETAFARKRKGVLDEEVTMPGPDGQALKPLGRITKW